MSRVAELLEEISVVCIQPKGMDAGAIEILTKRLMRMIGEYAEPIAIRALDDWPKRHRFFPTENELREELDRAAGFHEARKEQSTKRYDDGMSAHPHGATRAFLDEFRAIAPQKAESFFDHGISRYGENRIGTRLMFVENIIEKYAPGLLAKHEVRIVEPYRYHIRARDYRDPNDRGYDIEWRW